MKKALIVLAVFAVIVPVFTAQAVTWSEWSSWTFPQKMAWLDAFRGGFCSGVLWSSEFQDNPGVTKSVMINVDDAVAVKYGEAVALIDFQWAQDSMNGKDLHIVANIVFSKIYDAAFWRVVRSGKK